MKMSVTRALAEMKRLDDRLAVAISSSQFVAVTIGKGDRQKVNGVSDTVSAVTSRIQSDIDSITSMIAKRAALKSAVVKSNAQVKVTIGGREMTVADAIELKASVSIKEQLVTNMQRMLNLANTQIDSLNSKLDAQIEANLATIYGADKAKADASVYEQIAKPQRDQKEAALLDPMKISDLIKKISDEVSVIKTELDFILSEANAKTEIEVE